MNLQRQRESQKKRWWYYHTFSSDIFLNPDPQMWKHDNNHVSQRLWPFRGCWNSSASRWGQLKRLHFNSRASNHRIDADLPADSTDRRAMSRKIQGEALFVRAHRWKYSGGIFQSKNSFGCSGDRKLRVWLTSHPLMMFTLPNDCICLHYLMCLSFMGSLRMLQVVIHCLSSSHLLKPLWFKKKKKKKKSILLHFHSPMHSVNLDLDLHYCLIVRMRSSITASIIVSGVCDSSFD